MTEDEIILSISKASPAPDLSDVMAMVTDLDADYTALITTLIALKIIKKQSEFEAKLRAKVRQQQIISALGSIPTNTAELVESVLDTCQFRVDPSSPTPLTWHCPIRGQRQPFDLFTMMQVTMEKNRNLLGGQFRDTDIRNECEFFQTRTFEAVRAAIAERLVDPTVTFDWDTLAKTCFDLSEVRSELVIASLQKLIWSVKRRMHGLPVSHHLMTVIYGAQGCGKTQFVTRLLESLGSLWTTTDFSRLTDNREASLFDNYVLFLDEMHKAELSHMDGVKAVITREKYSFRPMNTNQNIVRPQMSSFIGCSNKLLAQLINDPTGNRRFFQIDFKSAADQSAFDYVNNLDFTPVWQSVDHLAEDPSKPFHEEMATMRELSINQSSVGLFVTYLVEHEGEYPVKGYDGNIGKKISRTPMRKEELYLSYRDFCEAMRIGRPMEQQAFLTELRRMMRQDSTTPFKDGVRTAGFNGWSYTGTVAVSVSRHQTMREKLLKQTPPVIVPSTDSFGLPE